MKINDIVEIILMEILAMLIWLPLMWLLFWPDNVPFHFDIVPGVLIGAAITCDVLYLRKDRASQKYK